MKMELEFVEGSFFVVNLLAKNNYQIDWWWTLPGPSADVGLWNHRVVLKPFPVLESLCCWKVDLQPRLRS